jgi:hypothetical protein
MTLNVLQLYGEEAQHRRQMAETINKILTGRANNANEFTLTAGATSTVVVDPAYESLMVPVFIPTTANAAAAVPTTYISARSKGSFTVTHANNGQTDKTFLYVRWG